MSHRVRMLELVEISFSNIEQAKAVRDVIEHRVHAVATDISVIPELEIDEVMSLVAFHHRLSALIDQEEQE